MMKLDKFMEMANLALKEPTIYKSGGWGKWNGTRFEFDCVCLIKGILWGWKGEHNGHGGAKYGSNGVPDIGDNTMYQACLNKSNDFSKISVGELVWMNGHVGIYAGNNNVIEATSNRVFNVSGVILSQLDKNGVRSYKGVKDGNIWKGHGFLPYIDYTSEAPKEKISLPSRGYFKKGDSGTSIEKIDEWLYERYGDKLILGNYFGNNTEKYVKKFQEEARANGTYTGKNATIDGYIGPLTLEAMRKTGFSY